MRLRSKFVPQADRLEDVVHVLEAINSGETTFQEIAKHIGMTCPRKRDPN